MKFSKMYIVHCLGDEISRKCNLSHEDSVKVIENKMNKLGKVYIAGKITGLTVEEFKANFERGVKDLEALGVSKNNIVNPARFTIDNGSWVEYMKLCLAKLIECDTIFMLDNYFSKQ